MHLPRAIALNASSVPCGCKHNSSYCYVFFDDICRAHRVTVEEAAEVLEPGTDAFRLLGKCVSALNWEIEW